MGYGKKSAPIVRVDNTELAAQLADNKKKIEYQKKQTEYLANFYKKITHDKIATIVCQGDSMTYGQDNNSADNRPADTNLTDDGTAHTQPRAGKTYPEALQENLQAIYGNQITVINKGYSGDWVEISYNHWNANSNADLALVMLGTNDSNLGASWVPGEVKGDLSKYIIDMRKLIERFLDWSTPVILLTPTRLYNQENLETTTSHITESYRNALFQLGEEYNIPVIDTELFMNGWDDTYYSDTVHLNTKGYTAFASRLTSILIGFLHSVPFINSGDALGVRVTRDNFIKSGGVVLQTSSGSYGAEEGISGEGVLAKIPDNEWIYYSFFTNEENLIFIPVFSVSSGVLELQLDFGTEQGSTTLLSSIEQDVPQGFKPLSTISTSKATNNSDVWNGNINKDTTNQYLHVVNKGFHVLRVKNTGSAGSFVYLNGFVVLSFKDFINQKKNQIVGHYSFQTHSTISDGSSISSSSVKLSDIEKVLGVTYGVDYWKHTPLIITVYNYDQKIIRYILQVGQRNSSGNYFILKTLSEVDLAQTVDPGQVRTLDSVSWDNANDSLIFNWGGALTRSTHIIITAA